MVPRRRAPRALGGGYRAGRAVSHKAPDTECAQPGLRRPAAQTSGCGSEGSTAQKQDVRRHPENAWGWGQGWRSSRKETEHRPPAAHTPEEAEPGRAGEARSAGRQQTPPRPQGRPRPSLARGPGPHPQGRCPGWPVSPQASTVATCSPAATWGPWPRFHLSSSAPPAPAWRSWRAVAGCEAGGAAGCRAGRKLCSLFGVLQVQGLEARGPGVTLATHSRLPPSRSSACGSSAAAWSPRAERHELPVPRSPDRTHTHFPWLGLSSMSGWPPLAARPHPFKGPGMGLPGVPEQTLGLVTREETLTGPAHPGATAHLFTCTSQCHK